MQLHYRIIHSTTDDFFRIEKYLNDLSKKQPFNIEKMCYSNHLIIIILSSSKPFDHD